MPAWLMVTGILWLYHTPLIILGWYGSLGGLPAFSVAILGFSAFVSVLTDRSRAIWPSVVAHGAWNALVATSFVESFSGDSALLGEFGWVAAGVMAVLGGATLVWHLRTGGAPRMAFPAKYGSDGRPSPHQPEPRDSSSKGATRGESTVDRRCGPSRQTGPPSDASTRSALTRTQCRAVAGVAATEPTTGQQSAPAIRHRTGQDGTLDW